MLRPPPRKEIKYLKVSELEVNKYYTCSMSGNKVFIRDNNIKSVMCRDAVEGIYYYLGEYKTAMFYNFMLYSTEL